MHLLKKLFRLNSASDSIRWLIQMGQMAPCLQSSAPQILRFALGDPTLPGLLWRTKNLSCNKGVTNGVCEELLE